jgi:hypothetical protein
MGQLDLLYLLKDCLYMNITLAQREALDVVKDMIDKSNTSVPDYGTKIMTLIFGILNVDCRVEHVAPSITADPDKPDNTLPIDYEGMRDGNDRLIVPDWIKTMPTPPFVPGDVSYPPQFPFPPQVWYEHKPKTLQTDAREDVRYATEVTCTGDKNCITVTRNPNDCVTYTETTTSNIPDGPPVDYTAK